MKNILYENVLDILNFSLISKDIKEIKYLKNANNDLLEYAIHRDGNAIRYINNPSKKLREMAIKQKPQVIRHLKNLTENEKILAVSGIPETIQYIQNPSRELIESSFMNSLCNTCKYFKTPSKWVKRKLINMFKKRSRKDKLWEHTCESYHLNVSTEDYFDALKSPLFKPFFNSFSEKELRSILIYSPLIINLISNPSKELISLAIRHSTIQQINSISEKYGMTNLLDDIRQIILREIPGMVAIGQYNVYNGLVSMYKKILVATTYNNDILRILSIKGELILLVNNPTNDMVYTSISSGYILAIQLLSDDILNGKNTIEIKKLFRAINKTYGNFIGCSYEEWTSVYPELKKIIDMSSPEIKKYIISIGMISLLIALKIDISENEMLFSIECSKHLNKINIKDTIISLSELPAFNETVLTRCKEIILEIKPKFLFSSRDSSFNEQLKKICTTEEWLVITRHSAPMDFEYTQELLFNLYKKYNCIFFSPYTIFREHESFQIHREDFAALKANTIYDNTCVEHLKECPGLMPFLPHIYLTKEIVLDCFKRMTDTDMFDYLRVVTSTNSYIDRGYAIDRYELEEIQSHFTTILKLFNIDIKEFILTNPRFILFVGLSLTKLFTINEIKKLITKDTVMYMIIIQDIIRPAPWIVKKIMVRAVKVLVKNKSIFKIRNNNSEFRKIVDITKPYLSHIPLEKLERLSSKKIVKKLYRLDKIKNSEYDTIKKTYPLKYSSNRWKI